MTSISTGMPLHEALAALRAARGSDDVVITTMGAAREWMAQGIDDPLDFVFVPSSMSQAPSLGLGLALAQPERRIIVVNGDGSMLMNLGSLVTIADRGPANLILIVCANGVYEVTGAQPTPGGDRVDFVDLALAAGFDSVYRYSDPAEWAHELPRVLDAEGPTFVLLEVAPVKGIKGPRSPGPAAERARRFMIALGVRALSTDPGADPPTR